MNSYEKLTRERVWAQIEAAFRSVPYPPNNDYAGCTPGDYDPERDDIQEAVQGRHWRDLSLYELPKSGLSFYTPEAFCFLLPAYMRVTLDSYIEADVIPNSLMYNLDPSFYAKLSDSERYERRVACFSLGQKRAIASFIAFLDQEYPEDFEDVEMSRLIELYSA